MKISVIGGGSSYTPELAEGIVKNYASFPVKELALVDIEEGKEKAEIGCALLKRMFQKAGLPVNVYFTMERKKALEGSDFVISQFRVGGLKARAEDERIPMKYGIIGQETTGPGGFANALRTIPRVLEVCRDIEAVCPEAWLVNFTNPSGIITEAILNNTGAKCIGLCNVPINMEREICRALGMEPGRVQCRFAGLNHLSFVGRLYVDGRDMLAIKSALPEMSANYLKNTTGPEIPADFIAALGVIPSPYLRYFFLERDMFREETEKFDETGRTRADEVMETERILFEKYRDERLAEKPEELSKRGGALYSEAAVSLMNSIWNDTRDIHVVNVQNRGAITGLPEDAVVETNCVVGKNGATPLAYGPLPDTIGGLVQQVKAYERLTIQAALTGNAVKAVLALAANPLVRDAKTAGVVFADILSANKKYLTNFKEA
jgi:6-phospho-beta-glucosidase